MLKKLAKLVKSFFGDKAYDNLRAWYLFRDLNSPYPLYPDSPFEMRWDEYQNTREDKEVVLIKSAYIVSPTQRSGTNFLSHILNKHPDLEFPSGPHLPDEQCLYTYSDLLKEYSYRTVSTWNKWIESGDDASLPDHSKALLGAMGTGILHYFSRFVKPQSILLFKTPDAGGLENYFHLFPHGKLIILIRDGRDTVESFSKSWGGSGAFKKMCQRWSARVDTISRFIKRAEDSGKTDQFLLIRYEDLNDNSSKEVEKILKFLEIDESRYPWDQIEKIPVLGSSSYKGTAGEVHWKPVEKDDKFNPTKKWITWDKKRKSIFKKFAGENLISLGYASNNDW